MPSELKAVILAAGKGTRMQTDGSGIPKVMRIAAGRPLLRHVLGALDFIAPGDTVIVVGYKKEQVISACPGYRFAEQLEQLGTGHAVMSAYTSELRGFEGNVLVCCGDMPLIRRESYLELTREHERTGAACTLLTSVSDVKLPYGRVLRSKNGGFLKIIEEKDCSPEQLKINELNSGVYVFNSRLLEQVLSGLKNTNSQGEYYLTDAPGIMLGLGMDISICRMDLGREIIGVNTPEQLHDVERELNER